MDEVYRVAKTMSHDLLDESAPGTFDAGKLWELAKCLHTVMRALHTKYMELRRHEYTVDETSRHYLRRVRDHMKRYLLDMYQDLSQARSDQGVRFSELVFWIMCTCTVMLYHAQISKDPARARKRATDFPSVVARELARSKDSILLYDCSQLLGALRQVARQWNTLVYDGELALYMDYLEYRVSMFLCETFDDDTHNLREYRGRPRKGGSEYPFNHRFLEEVTWYHRAFYQKIARHDTFPSVQVPPVVVTLSQERVQQWVEDTLEYVHSEAIYDEYRNKYLKACLRPAEVSLYRRDHPDTTPKLLQVLKHFRNGAQYRTMMERANGTGRALLDTDEGWARTLFLIRLVHFRLYNTYRVDWESQFLVYGWEFERQHWLMRNSRLPVLVQLFGDEFGLAYRENRWRVPGGFLAALTQWLQVVRDDFHGHVPTNEDSVDVREIFQQIEGESGQGREEGGGGGGGDDAGHHSSTEFEIRFEKAKIK